MGRARPQERCRGRGLRGHPLGTSAASAPPRAAVLLLLSCAALAPGGCGEAPVPEAPARPNLLLVTIDTLRADHLGSYGYLRDTSPHIDAFARDALLFERAYAPMSSTLPSHVSLLTGTDPVRHGIVSNFHFFGQAVVTGEGLRSAAEMLASAGWATAAFTSASPLAEATGIARGFQVFQAPPEWETNRRRLEVRAGDTVDAARAWLVRAPRPFFLWVHLFDPHDPYAAPEPFARAFRAGPELVERLRARGFPAERLEEAAATIDAYDGEIAYADHEVGRLLATVRKLELWNHTVIVLAGDHGEGLWQHGHPAHGLTWNEQVQVPLVVRLPDGPRGRSPAVASLVDVLPTLAAHADLPLDAAQSDGVDLLSGASRPALSQRVVRRHRPEPAFTLTSRRWKYWHFADEADRLYDLAADPHELDDVIGLHPDVARVQLRELRERVADLEARAVVPVEQGMPVHIRQQLRELGYVE